jgi:hypothetical protein
MSGSVKHQAEPMCKASSGTAQSGPERAVRTFFTVSRAPSAPAPDGLAPLLVAQAAGNRRAGSALHPALTGRGGRPLRSRGGSSTAPFRAGALRARRLPQVRWPVPRRDRCLAIGRWPRPQERTAVPLAPGILSPSKDHRQGALAALASCGWRKRHPLSSDLPRRTLAPIEGNGGESRSTQPSSAVRRPSSHEKGLLCRRWSGGQRIDLDWMQQPALIPSDRDRHSRPSRRPRWPRETPITSAAAGDGRRQQSHGPAIHCRDQQERRFQLSLPLGTYRLTGHSPQVVADGHPMLCTGTRALDVTKNKPAPSVQVVCSIP